MPKNTDADLNHAVLDLLEDQGSLTSREIVAEITGSWSDFELGSRPTQTDVYDTLRRLGGLELIVEVPHEDARATQGGCPAVYKLAPEWMS